MASMLFSQPKLPAVLTVMEAMELFFLPILTRWRPEVFRDCELFSCRCITLRFSCELYGTDPLVFFALN